MKPASPIAAAATILGFFPPWAVALGVFVAIVVLGVVLQGLIVRFLSVRAKRWHPLVQLIFLRTRRVGRFAIILFAVAVALPLVPTTYHVATAGNRILVAAFIVLLGWIATIALNIAIDRYEGGLRLDATDNLLARKAATQMRVVRRALNVVLAIITVAFALMNFDAVRQFGISLFASAGIAGIVAGLAARPLFENLFAGLQLALTQPLRLEDAVVINNEWGWVEEITSTYIVVRLWDWRRQIVPLSYLFENPFANWTRSSASLIGTVFLYLDYTLPVDALRAKAEEIARASKLWDGKVINVQVSDARETAMEVRILISAADSPKTWDARCEMREKLIAWVQQTHPHALPRLRREDFRMAGGADGRDRAEPARSLQRQ